VRYAAIADEAMAKSVNDDLEETSFKDCKNGRSIVFDKDKYSNCAGYGDRYAQGPSS
jgi:hypothetical protein